MNTLPRPPDGRSRMNSRVSQIIAGWRTGLPRPVLILQAGNALNYFGYGLILPFEIIYLHQLRGFSTSTAGLVLAATMGTAAIVTLPTGALLDRYSAKAIVVAGSLASALGYAGFAYVDVPWQAVACSVVSGAGIGLAGTANRVLITTLVEREQRAASFALARVAGNFGLGLGATVAGFIVAAAQQLSSFQALYVFDGITYAGFALVVLAAVPIPPAAPIAATDTNGSGFRAVARDRLFLTVIAANIVLLVVGHTFFSNILAPFAAAHTSVGPAALGLIFLVNTSFVVIAQIPAVRVVARMRRTHAFAAAGALFAVDPVGARGDRSPGRRGDRLRHRRVLPHRRARAAGRGHGARPPARPLSVCLRPELQHLAGHRPGGRWPAPADLAGRGLVGWRDGRGVGWSRAPPTRRPHSRPAPRSAGTSGVGARGPVRTCQEKVMGWCAGSAGRLPLRASVGGPQ